MTKGREEKGEMGGWEEPKEKENKRILSFCLLFLSFFSSLPDVHSPSSHVKKKARFVRAK